MLNMDNLHMTEEWVRNDTYWHRNDILATIAKVAVDLSNYTVPRKLELVLSKFIEKFVFDSNLDTLVYTTMNKLVDDVFAVLMDIKEFREWNLTTYEYEHGVDVDGSEEERQNCFIESPEKDFIDLDAFKQNLYCEFRSMLIDNYFFEGSMCG